MNKKILIVIAILIVGAGSFYGGLAYGKTKTTALRAGGAFPTGQRTGQGMGFAGGNFAGRGTGGPNGAGGITAGEVISNDTTSVVVKTREGGSKIVFFASSTQVMKSALGSVSDVTPGQEITVTGSANSDGSMTAQSIQIRPTTTTQR